MSLNSIMSTAVSGMGVAQTGLSTVSDNIANVNTPGYVRKIVEQSSSVTNGIGTGVMVAQIRRAADSYLQSASLTASSTAGKSGAVADLLDQAQSLFGDPSSATNYFNQLNDVFNAFGAAANDPASSLTRAQTLDKVTTFLDSTQRIASGMQAVSQQADTRITSDVQQINQLLSQIDALNTDITRSQASGGDATGSLDAQSQLIDKLSTLMDVKVQARTNGGVVLRTDTGVPLAGEGGPATLDYLPSSGGPGQVTITQFGATASQTLNVSSGELRGLLDVRNVQLPAVQDQLGE
ncbi:MAG TPA: flagellar hook-associated protein FlgK, partial [Caulobacteraceae bacterium]|nr:flagellar hook-associated protein FlgK [Caulobacteraceae bacterium]